jgi:hypothetical protein
MGIDELKFGCVCSYLMESQILIKIELKPYNSMIIYVASSD